MKRLFGAFLALVLLFCSVPAYANDITTFQKRLDGTVLELEAYLAGKAEDARTLETYIDNFYAVGSKNGTMLGAYCEVLLCLINEKYELAVKSAQTIAENAAFSEYVSGELESDYICDGNTLYVYAQARRAEAAGDGELALSLYEDCYIFFDALARGKTLADKLCEQKYEQGNDAFDRGDYITAEECFAFTVQYDYRNSANMLKITREELKATPAPTEKPRATPSPQPAQTKKPSFSGYGRGNAIAAGEFHTVALRSNGTVVATGTNYNGQLKVGDWRDIISVAAGRYHTVGLKSDGTVVAVGHNEDGQCDVGSWRDIVAISAGYWHTVGLKSDGTVVAVGRSEHGQLDVDTWRGVVSVAGGNSCTLGLMSDGTVVGTGMVYAFNKNVGKYSITYDISYDVSQWRNIVAVSGGGYHVVGLKSDGTVVAAGDTYYSGCDVGAWRDVVAVSAGLMDTVGVMSDGTVVATDSVGGALSKIYSMRDIVAVSAYSHAVCLDSNGRVYAAGKNEYGRCDTKSWSNIGR